MTEQEWLTCTNLRQLLDALYGKASPRKLHLVGCACCRLVWHLLPDRCHRLVEAVEGYVEERIGRTELVSLFDGYFSGEVATTGVPGAEQAAEAVGHLGWEWRWSTNSGYWSNWYNAGRVTRSAAEALAKTIPWQDARRREEPLLHDIFGTSLFRPAAFNPGWLAWDNATVRKLCQVIFDDRAFDRLPILADALEEAACDNKDILDHCRGPGPHVRGCWVVDLLLAKQ